MYKLKQLNEDFKVDELLEFEDVNNGKFRVYLMKKDGYTTLKAIDTIAKRIKTRQKDICFAGMKDKDAITTQYISIPGKQRALVMDRLSIEFKGSSSEKLSLGDNLGNKFTIVVRNITTKPKKITEFYNKYDSQRFSSNNFEIGLSIIKKKHKEAIELILQNKGNYEIRIQEYLKIHPTDYIGAIRLVPMKVLTLIIHSVQSKIFNKLLTMSSEPKLPLIGFDFNPSDPCYKEALIMMIQYDIKPRDFILPSLPRLTSETTYRDSKVQIDDLKIGKLEEDELNLGMKKITVSFMLQKGSYATAVIEAMF